MHEIVLEPVGVVRSPANEVIDHAFGRRHLARGIIFICGRAVLIFAASKRTGVCCATMLGGRTSEEWIAQYASSHRHPVNRLCHSLGIPAIVVSLPLFGASLFYHPLWKLALGLFLFGWALQFVGHAFERKEPEFFHDWRFLFVGLRWWMAKMRGRA